MRKRNLAALIATVLVLVYAGLSTFASRSVHRDGVQDPSSLDRRITTLETRLFSIESNMRLIQQQVSINSRTQPAPLREDPVVDTLQRQVLILQSQLDDLRCGVAKLDERTLPSRKRTTGGAPDTGADRCRANPDLPIMLAPVR